MPAASYASVPARSRGRLHKEAESATRSAFQRDRDRIIHSAAFRRLEYKTQVFVYHEGDYFRTRLTHSLETAQIARSISRVLGLDEDLAEALALAHDLGHTPFGHAGEDALDEAMRPYGGFDHNAQTLKILTSLEQRYAGFDGLNLTWETLEGVAKHNGPLLPVKGAKTLPEALTDYVARHDLELDTYPGPEAQVAALSDDIAYNNHDIDDGLRAGLFTVADLKDVPLVGPIFAALEVAHPGLDQSRLIHEAVRAMIGAMVEDLTAESQRRVAAAKPKSVDDVRRLGRPLIAFSDEMRANDVALKRFLYERMYRHYKVNRMASRARRVVRELFALFIAEPECLPTDWRALCDGSATLRTARMVADYIAGMTDRYAFKEHHRLFGPPES
ncbi:MAG: deoxyguanosinetriphosphate triphosphohydrolase [Alphaproteobacteria bacterium]|nr:deoxyguanosinetriphosphate triphosphohydrolase [Alphaproteobacteria bacterium]